MKLNVATELKLPGREGHAVLCERIEDIEYPGRWIRFADDVTVVLREPVHDEMLIFFFGEDVIHSLSPRHLRLIGYPFLIGHQKWAKQPKQAAGAFSQDLPTILL